MNSSTHASSPRHALDAVVHPDPYPWYRRRVVEQPLAFDDELGLWIAASAEAVRAVLGHPSARVRPSAEPVPAALVGSNTGALFGRWARMTDGAFHARLKPVLTQTLVAPSQVDELRPPPDWCEAAAAGGVALDAFVLGWPVQAMAGLVGLTSHEAVALEVRSLVAAVSPRADTAARERGETAASALLQRWSQAVATPLSTLLAQAAQEAGIDFQIQRANAISLLVQTQDATAGLLANTLHLLSSDVALTRALRDGTVPWQPVLDEVLRFDAPVQNTRRWLADDVQVLGHTLRAGDAVLVLLAAANHDAAVNPAPERFDWQREAPVSFTFGLGGHACPGARLARRLAAAALQGLLDAGLDPQALGAGRHWYPLPNARIARFAPIASQTTQQETTP